MRRTWPRPDQAQGYGYPIQQPMPSSPFEATGTTATMTAGQPDDHLTFAMQGPGAQMHPLAAQAPFAPNEQRDTSGLGATGAAGKPVTAASVANEPRRQFSAGPGTDQTLKPRWMR